MEIHLRTDRWAGGKEKTSHIDVSVQVLLGNGTPVKIGETVIGDAVRDGIVNDLVIDHPLLHLLWADVFQRDEEHIF